MGFSSRPSSHGALLLSLVICIGVSFVGVSAANPSCSSLGYSENLLCSSCQKLAQYLPEGERALLDECKNCCAEDAEEEADMQYIKATLTVCNWKMGRFPEVQDFVRNRSHKLKNFVFTPKPGGSPELTLEKEDGTTEVIGIGDWKADTIEEFLNSRLKQ